MSSASSVAVRARPCPVSSDQALLVAYLAALILDAAASPSLPRQRSLGAASHASSDDCHHQGETLKEHTHAVHHHNASFSADNHGDHGEALVPLLRHSGEPVLDHLLRLRHDRVPSLLLLLRHHHVPGLVIILGSHLEKEDVEEDGGHAKEEGDETAAAQDHDDEGAYDHGRGGT